MNEATIAEMADSTSTVNTLGALGSDGTVVRDRYNQVAHVQLTGTEVVYVSKAHLTAWVKAKGQRGTDAHSSEDMVHPLPIA